MFWTCLVPFQLKSNPSNKEEREAQNQLEKSDEIQRLLAQAHDSYSSRDCGTAVALLDAVIEVKHTLSRCCYRRFPSPPPSPPNISRFFLLFADLRLGRGLSWDESRVLNWNGGNGEGHQWPESHIQVKERQHPGVLQTQHHLLRSGRPRDVPQVRHLSHWWLTTSERTPFRSWSLFSPCVQWGARVPEAGSRPQAVLQPLQESPKAQQADSVCGGADPGAEVGVCVISFSHATCSYLANQMVRYYPSSTSLLCMWNPDSSQARGNERGKMISTYCLISDCVLELFVWYTVLVGVASAGGCLPQSLRPRPTLKNQPCKSHPNVEACPVVCDFAPELLSAKLTAGTRTELKWRSKPRCFSSKTPPLAFQVRGCRQQIRSSDEDRAQRAALHRPGQGEDLPRSGPGWSCSNRALAGFVAKLISNVFFFSQLGGQQRGFVCCVPLSEERDK